VNDAGAPRGRVRRGLLIAGIAVFAVAALVLGARLAWRAQAGYPGAVGKGSDAPIVLAPGERPFDRGERASYRVTWQVDAGSGLAAGRLAFEAAGAAGARYLAVDVETAAWAVSFYDLHGRIESWTDADVRPSRQELHLRSGRRTIDRTTWFDGRARTFAVNEGAPIALPDGARDGLSAWFHVRTLPLAPGYAVRLPVIEAGRVYELTGRVDGVERVPSGGRQVEAFRLSLRVTPAAGGDDVVRATAWFSSDPRRIPLAIDVATALGPFRAELDRYERR